eukprot:6576399-Pyramimonas_sp.AAC.1
MAAALVHVVFAAPLRDRVSRPRSSANCLLWKSIHENGAALKQLKGTDAEQNLTSPKTAIRTKERNHETQTTHTEERHTATKLNKHEKEK